MSENCSESVDRNIPLNEKAECRIADANSPNWKSALVKSGSEKKDGWTTPLCKYYPQECKGVQTDTVNSGLVQVKDSEITGDIIERDSAEKIKMEVEVHHLREMLRSQTARCEAQQDEINRLMIELKLNEDKCKSTLQKLDKRLSVFENLEKQSRKDTRETMTSSRKSSPLRTPAAPFRPNSAPKSNRTYEEGLHESDAVKGKTQNQPESPAKPTVQLNEDNALDRHLHSRTFQSLVLGHGKSESNTENAETKQRFVDQVFLEWSDEDQPENVPLKEISSQREMSMQDDTLLNSPTKVPSEKKDLKARKSSKISVSRPEKRSFSSLSSEFKFSADLTTQEKKDQKIKISILWLDIDANSSLWNNSQVKLLFIDFTFLDLRGESTETPQSLPKPTLVGKKCEFNFVKEVEINDNRRRILQNLMSKPDLDLIIFKVVSDSEDFDQLTDFECEDVGVAVVTVKQFIEKYNKGLFLITVKNTEDTKEVIGKLAVSIEITSGLFNPRN